MIVLTGQTVIVLIANVLDILRRNAGINIKIKDQIDGGNQNHITYIKDLAQMRQTLLKTLSSMLKMGQKIPMIL
jgi:hypothetical protein